MGLPEYVHITEVGPRDGLQMEKQVIDTSTKCELILGLVAAGIHAVQVGAFVHPRRVPQMADAEAVVAQLPLVDDVQFSALTLNMKGVVRALRTGLPWIEVSIAVSETQSGNNVGMSVEQARREARAMIAAVRSAGRKVRASIQCAFGYTDPLEIAGEQVAEMARFLLDQGVSMLLPADTTGMATPDAVRRLLDLLLPLAGRVPLGLHLHDTRGLGLVNVMAALQMGVSHFDSSLGGLGGCPFIAGAAGNIATEDAVHFLTSLGIRTGIDTGKVSAWSRRLSAVCGREPAGRYWGAGK
ncbi:MAG: hydroxymethylglutaryl-CoA lyase [Desulfatitalea sp.]|nr:hydroxymethylglutaryl-CoA lyase [Desulfatitalea sp.]NNJ99831.1 hydroxymethylglutaryl-CoA lyase [Desulfatitalea sp.]